MKDVLLFLSGITIGLVIMLFLAGRVLHDVEKVDGLGKFIFLSFKGDDKKKHIYVNIKSVYQAMELLIRLIFFRNVKRTYGIKVENRDKILARIIVVTLFILCLLSVLFILNPIIL